MLSCSQIWLNLPVDHCHFGYNHKIGKKKHCSRKATFDKKERQLGVDGGCQMVEWQQ
jgi:hypothetical protein